MTEAMGESANTGILVFESIHYVLAAERAFLQANLWCDMIPTPRTISSNCGMVLQFRYSHAAPIAELISRLATPPVGAYRCLDGGYQPDPRLAQSDSS